MSRSSSLSVATLILFTFPMAGGVDRVESNAG